jgi:hypothetical protein
MTLAVAGPTSTQPTVPHTVPIAILGTDALLAALPATPVQLAHACLQAGFANVIPASWGDELIAAAVLRRLPQFGSGPAIHCSCPIVAHRLLTVGGDLRPVLLPLVSPPVAIARYVRTLSQPTRTRVTYIGCCPGATDDSIDIRMTPDALIAMLAERQITLDDQPRVFESIIPPDRRRFRSQPGGLPAAEVLWGEAGSRTLVEIDGEDLVAELAQHLLAGKNVLIDVSARLGCVCSGAAPGVLPGDARARVVSLEPPRATTPVVEEGAPIELDSHVPAASRTPIDVVAIMSSSPAPLVIAPPRGEMPFGNRISPVRGISALTEPRPARVSNPAGARPVGGMVPIARDVDGKSLPRAYVARRRSSPRGIPIVSLSPDDLDSPSRSSPKSVPRLDRRPEPTPELTPRPASPLPAPVAHAPSTAAVVPSVSWPISPRHLAYIAVAALALVIGVSTVVAVVVGRSIGSPPAAAPTQR